LSPCHNPASTCWRLARRSGGMADAAPLPEGWSKHFSNTWKKDYWSGARHLPPRIPKQRWCAVRRYAPKRTPQLPADLNIPLLHRFNAKTGKQSWEIPVAEAASGNPQVPAVAVGEKRKAGGAPGAASQVHAQKQPLQFPALSRVGLFLSWSVQHLVQDDGMGGKCRSVWSLSHSEFGTPNSEYDAAVPLPSQEGTSK